MGEGENAGTTPQRHTLELFNSARGQKGLTYKYNVRVLNSVISLKRLLCSRLNMQKTVTIPFFCLNQVFPLKCN